MEVMDLNETNGQAQTVNTQMPHTPMPQAPMPDGGRKSSGGQCLGGLLVGLLAGVVLTVTIATGVMLGYVSGGRSIVIGKKPSQNISLSENEEDKGESGVSILDAETIAKMSEIVSYLKVYYMDPIDVEKVQEAMIEGMVDGLGDKYTRYYSAEDYADMKISTTGKYSGIGAALSQNLTTMEVTVAKVYPGTPAEEAGLLSGDIIISVEDIDATSMELSDLVTHTRGEEGTPVHLEMYRPDTKEFYEVDVVRRRVEIPSVAGEMLEDGIGYIEIGEFQTGTAQQFENILRDLEEQGMEALIVDLRGNPGGLIDSVAEILDTILPEGILVYTRDKYDKGMTFTSDAKCIDYPLAVLINESSASASEIFAGAIKDYNYGTLIGTTTYGKGIVQSLFPLSDDDALKITTAKYYTPNGVNIHGVGIDPDIELEFEYTGEDRTKYEKQYDNQLQKAIEVLKKGQ